MNSSFIACFPPYPSTVIPTSLIAAILGIDASLNDIEANADLLPQINTTLDGMAIDLGLTQLSVSNIETDVDDIRESLDNIEADVDTIADAIGPSGEIPTLLEDIESNTDLIPQINASLNEIEADVDDIRGSLDNIEIDVDTIADTVGPTGEITTLLEDIDTSLDNIEADVDTIADAVGPSGDVPNLIADVETAVLGKGELINLGTVDTATLVSSAPHTGTALAVSEYDEILLVLSISAIVTPDTSDSWEIRVDHSFDGGITYNPLAYFVDDRTAGDNVTVTGDPNRGRFDAAADDLKFEVWLKGHIGTHIKIVATAYDQNSDADMELTYTVKGVGRKL